MEALSYTALERAGYTGYLTPRDAPVRVLQFGEGNFLRSFVDRYIDLANEAGEGPWRVAMVQPIDGAYAVADGINAQDGLYTVCIRGRADGAVQDSCRVISCVDVCLNPYRDQDRARIREIAVSPELELIISNTTEAGIVYDAQADAAEMPARTFPAKLAQMLHARWAAGLPGVIILSCELIDHNGAELERIVRAHVRDWGWEDAFDAWLTQQCRFVTTLVDTIVPGRIRDARAAEQMEERLGYRDPFLAVREPFQMWGVEGDEALAQKLPWIRAALPGAFVTPDVTPYKKRKVRILNGAHTGFVPAAWLAGFDIVRDAMEDPQIGAFAHALIEDEVIPSLAGELDRADLEAFATSVWDRFLNPFIDHQLLSICLNSVAKWRARDLPSLEAHVGRTGRVPACLAMSLAALIAYYTCGFEGLEENGLNLRRTDGTAYVASDDREVLAFFAAHAMDAPEQLAHATLANTAFWGRDLTRIEGLEATVARDLATIRTQGALAALALVV